MHIQHLPSVFVMFESQCNKVSPTKCYLQESSSYEIKGKYSADLEHLVLQSFVDFILLIK